MKKTLLKNFWMKTGSVFAAVVVWFMITGEISTSVTFVGIRPEIFLPEGMMIVGNGPQPVDVTLVGPKEPLDNTDRGSLKISVDLLTVTEPGRISFTLTHKDIKIPSRTKVQEISPSRVTVEVDKIARENFPVEVVFDGKPSMGWLLAGFSLDRTVIPVTGPKGILEKLKTVKTEPLNLTGHSKTFLQMVPLRIPGLPSASNPSVEVLVRIERSLSNREIRDIPIQILEAPPSVMQIRVEPKTIKVLVSGPKDIVESMIPSGIRSYVETIGLEPGQYELPVSVDVTANVKVEEIDPKVATVVIGDAISRDISSEEPGLLDQE
ncbi:MAG: CdaR family protein [Candidatus Theseobacter exili]|nr:CdaR family protein [Candidatus Theseobacter exili]